MLQEPLLFLQERLEFLGRDAPARGPAVADLLEFGADALLKHLEAVLAELAVEVGQVGDGADGRQDGVIADEGVLGTEGGDHYKE